jgi:hypothetical protein
MKKKYVLGLMSILFLLDFHSPTFAIVDPPSDVTTTPSLAMKSEPFNLPTIEGTLWWTFGVGPQTGYYYGFHGGIVYDCFPPSPPCITDPCPLTGQCRELPDEQPYIDYFFFALLSFQDTTGFLLPLVGIGVAMDEPNNAYYLLIKEADNWSPKGE